MDDGVDIEVETDDVDIDRLPANRDPPIIYETFETGKLVFAELEGFLPCVHIGISAKNCFRFHLLKPS